MGCSSCGRKYPKGKTQVRAPSVASPVVRGKVVRRSLPLVRKKVTPVAIPPNEKEIEVGPVVVQAQPPQGVVIPAPTYEIDPSSGLPLDVLKTGSCPANDVGDTALPPLGVEASKKYEGGSE